MIDLKSCHDWLAAQQSRDGSFGGQASRQIAPFEAERVHPTIFFTALILDCLENTNIGRGVIDRGLKYLKMQQSAIGSWNYWQRDAAITHDYPYPDDLDDTACSLLALSIYEPNYIDGQQMAQLAKLLIVNEIAPGGPYRTWLVEPALYKQWGDVDLAVNANIGALLARHKVKVPALEAFVSQKLAAVEPLFSAYYVGEVPILYFLARWYRGDSIEHLRSRTSSALKAALNESNSLHLAMLLTAGCHLKLPSRLLERAHQKLIALAHGNHWPAEALYMDPVIDGVQYYAGSKPLTTAYAIEAIKISNNFKGRVIKLPPSNSYKLHQPIIKLPTEMKQAYKNATERIIKSRGSSQVTAMANITAAAYKLNIKSEILNDLNLASLNGWVTYTIFDDLYDEEGQAIDIPVANFAARQAIDYYQRALPGNQSFHDLVFDSYDTMDTANRWEVLNTRAKFVGQKLYYKLPDYANYSKLAERSWGHMLSACGVLIASGRAFDDPAVKQLQRFFHHFLIARQLNDDAHDWLDDLKHGQLTAVNAMLLSSYTDATEIDINSQETELKQYFWQTTIDEVSDLIFNHISLARRALRRTEIIDDSQFAGWLDKIEAATDQALNGSHQTRDFINAYSKY